MSKCLLTLCLLCVLCARSYSQVITNGSYESLSRTSTWVFCTVVSTNATNPTLTVYYGTSDGGSNAASWASSNLYGAAGVGTISNHLTSLSPSQLYYYRWYALDSVTNASNWAGASSNFTTLAGVPTNSSPGVPYHPVMCVSTSGVLAAPTNFFAANTGALATAGMVAQAEFQSSNTAHRSALSATSQVFQSHFDGLDLTNSIVATGKWDKAEGLATATTFRIYLDGVGGSNAVMSTGKWDKVDGLATAQNLQLQIDPLATASHARSHALGSTDDHTGITGTENNFFALDGSGMLKDSTYSSASFCPANPQYLMQDAYNKISVATATWMQGDEDYTTAIWHDPDGQGLHMGTNGVSLFDITADGVKMRDGVSIFEFSSDGTLADNSDAAVPTEKAVKTYVDTEADSHYVAGTNDANTMDNTATGKVWDATLAYVPAQTNLTRAAITNDLMNGTFPKINLGPTGSYQIGGTNIMVLVADGVGWHMFGSTTNVQFLIDGQSINSTNAFLIPSTDGTNYYLLKH